jgi:hypothetical protein
MPALSSSGRSASRVSAVASRFAPPPARLTTGQSLPTRGAAVQSRQGRGPPQDAGPRPANPARPRPQVLTACKRCWDASQASRCRPSGSRCRPSQAAAWRMRVEARAVEPARSHTSPQIMPWRPRYWLRLVDGPINTAKVDRDGRIAHPRIKIANSTPGVLGRARPDGAAQFEFVRHRSSGRPFAFR